MSDILLEACFWCICSMWLEMIQDRSTLAFHARVYIASWLCVPCVASSQAAPNPQGLRTILGTAPPNFEAPLWSSAGNMAKLEHDTTGARSEGQPDSYASSFFVAVGQLWQHVASFAHAAEPHFPQRLPRCGDRGRMATQFHTSRLWSLYASRPRVDLLHRALHPVCAFRLLLTNLAQVRRHFQPK